MTGKMKILPEDFARLAQLIGATIAKCPTRKQEYTDKGLSPMRFRWDTYNVTTDNAQHEGRIDDYLFLRRLYDYLNDDNVDAALRSIIKQH